MKEHTTLGIMLQNISNIVKELKLMIRLPSLFMKEH